MPITLLGVAAASPGTTMLGGGLVAAAPAPVDLTDDMARPSPARGARAAAPDDLGPDGLGAAAAPYHLFLNFSDGTEALTLGEVDRASTNQSAVGSADPYPAFIWQSFAAEGGTRDDVIDAVARRVHQAFLPFNVILTTVRPTTGVYTMVMIGGGPRLFDLPPEVAGLALVDCRNRQAQNVAFAFPETARGSLHTLFVTIAQEAAHNYGLVHTDNPVDLMYPSVTAEQSTFPDQVSPVVGEPVCGFSTQNSFRQMLAALGAWQDGDKPLEDGRPRDTAPPTIAIEEPLAGAQVGDHFAVRVTASDDVSIDRVTLEAGGQRAQLQGPPWLFHVSGFPAGDLTLTATAIDGAGKQAVAVTSVVVDAGADEAGGCRVNAGRRGGGVPGAAWLVALAGTAACARPRRRL